jgi:hypothetical protein
MSIIEIIHFPCDGPGATLARVEPSYSSHARLLVGPRTRRRLAIASWPAALALFASAKSSRAEGTPSISSTKTSLDGASGRVPRLRKVKELFSSNMVGPFVGGDRLQTKSDVIRSIEVTILSFDKAKTESARVLAQLRRQKDSFSGNGAGC